VTAGTFTARTSPWRLALLALGAAAFVFGGLLIAGVLGPSPRPGSEWIGWLCASFFGLGGVVAVRRIFDGGDVVRISANGVYFKSWSEQTIPWSEIIDVTVWEFQRQKSIILHLRSPDRFPSTKLLGMVAGANRALTGGDVPVSLTGTDGSFEDAMTAIAYYRQRGS